MDNKEYARILKEISILRQIRGDNHFKIRAYENGARAIENLADPLESLMDEGDITQIEGIGKSLAKELESLRETGVSSVHQELLVELDPGLLDLMKIQGLGPKRIKTLYDELGISNVDLLKEAAESGKIADVEGLGKKTQEKILAEIERLAQSSGRMPLPAARAIAYGVRDKLKEVKGVEAIDVAGSIRRGRETIGDIDILVATSGEPQPIFEAFVTLPEVEEVLVRGDTKTSARLRNGMQVDVRIVRPEQFGAALHYFTGSKEHHVKLRTRAKKMGLKINEYGVFPRDSDTPVASKTEEDLYACLDLQFIPPELREGRDEIDLAEESKVPKLVEASDMLGDLHMHTTETDGRNTILEMVEAAKARNYRYIAITDHSQAVTVAGGMTPNRFEAQIAQIREINQELEDFRIYSGIEVDILKDGSLDMDHDLLRETDWVVASVHSHFNLPKEEMTARVIRAVESGLVHCLGHATGRILGGRDGYDLDIGQVMDACAVHGVAMEINGSTGRLDLNADLARMAHDRGVKIVLTSDAHSTRGLEDLDYALQQARRAGLTKADIMNTAPELSLG
ncbi:DNA polymerase/3'-5' exonuclease PolX [Microvenator marinus]|uniref:DNA polymerase beta n=1 Tax=Microvenator marinus TaxID=2600177 RepID=A0A5B8XZF9_9DELT|nr:DNA polymerase/3'-5' exonuclease PolX [Microvenator marinus]QED29056.1 DNA polymerase/3'-5' exonuclease PolX [Microvenator marinus]